jgi:DNA-binding HxlR family transcriptional regulator
VKRSSVGHFNCSIARALDVVGEWWTLLIIRDVFLGVRRFEAIQADLGIARNVLSDRLDRLVAEGILEPTRYEDHPPRHDYLLTEKGEDLLDVMLALWRWGERWDPVPADVRRVMTHRTCGAETYGVVVCDHCGEPLERDQLKLRPLLPVVAARLAAAAVTAPGGPTTPG